MKRRAAGAAIATAAALVALAGIAWFLYRASNTVTIERRADQNILLITIDTLRADALGCYGAAVRTPNLDQLASEGLRFDFAHAHAVLTRPSHTSILTGLYPYEHGVRDHSGYRMKTGTPTIATILSTTRFWPM